MTSKSNNKETGSRGEELATEYLLKKSYKIIERNFRTRFGEIDIVCQDGETLVFVEVKTKIGHDFGEPEEMVNRGKLAQVRRMGEVYLELKNQKLETMPTGRQDAKNQNWKGLCRVDVVAVVLSKNGKVEKICHYECVY